MDADDDDFLTMDNDDFYRLDGDGDDILSHWEEMLPPSKSSNQFDLFQLQKPDNARLILCSKLGEQKRTPKALWRL